MSDRDPAEMTAEEMRAEEEATRAAYLARVDANDDPYDRAEILAITDAITAASARSKAFEAELARRDREALNRASTPAEREGAMLLRQTYYETHTGLVAPDPMPGWDDMPTAEARAWLAVWQVST